MAELESAARDTADAILLDYSTRLHELAEDIAEEREASKITPPYIRQAAARLGLSKRSDSRDVLLAVGPSLLTFAAGVWVPLLISPPPELPGWVVPLIVAAMVVGALLTGIAVAPRR